MDKGNLSKIERGLLQWNQETLTGIAKALSVHLEALVTRGPADPISINRAYQRATVDQRRQIEAIAETIVGLSDRK